MATLFSDNFNRTDSVTPGNSWVEDLANWDIVSNQLRATDAVEGRITNTTSLGTADYSCELTHLPITQSSGARGPIGRSPDSSNFYLWQWNGTNNYELYKKVAGSFTLLGSATATSTDGERIKLSMQGTTIKGIREGVDLVVVTDPDLAAAGLFGIRNGGVANIDFDNYIVTDFASGAVLLPQAVM